MSYVLVAFLSAAATIVSLTAPGSPAALSSYRSVTLGDALSAVVVQLRLASSSVRVLTEGSSPVHEATWRPARFISGEVVVPDPLAEMVLTFQSERLVRIVATYDRDRVAGLTDGDLVDLLSAEYGPALLPSSTRRDAGNAAPARHVLAAWADSDTRLLLWRDEYPHRVGLTISWLAAESGLETSIMAGARERADSAPQRARDAQAAAAKAQKEHNERIRRENKAGFKP